jgi:hypothetical protein
MEFDSADLATLEASGQLYDVVLHEMGHLLGIGTIWQALGLLRGAGTTNPRFLGARATAEYNAIFGTSGTSVPVEGRPSGLGSRDSHWRESVFGNELMSPYISGTPNPISRVTVASLADLGYTVNMNAADPYIPPLWLIGGDGAGSGGGRRRVPGAGRHFARVQLSYLTPFRAACHVGFELPPHVLLEGIRHAARTGNHQVTNRLVGKR